jgi:arylsulfatase A-like enzyme
MTEAKVDRPNIVLIHVDQWRGDCLGCEGHPTVETPHLDLFRQMGMNFSNAYAAVPSCIASRASLWTGMTQRSHGRVGYRDGVHWDYDTTLAGTLSAAGYHTQAVGKMHVYPERNLIGFHNVILHDGMLHRARRNNDNHHLIDDYLPWLRERRGVEVDYIDTGIACNGYVVSPWCYDIMEHPSAWVATQAVDFLRRRDPSKPFFLYSSFHRPHPPLDPPQAYLDLYKDKELPPLPLGDWAPESMQEMRGFDSPCKLSAYEIDRARRAYYAQLTFIDHQVNRIIQSLYDHRVLENTWIIFTSDHGDMLYDHNRVAKGIGLEGSAGVPLIVRFPLGYEGKLNFTSDIPVEMRDIFPTICDIAGIDIPAKVEGKSFLPFCKGETVSWREYVHGEHGHLRGSAQWLTDGKIKYLWYSLDGEELLFDLANDPQETRNLAPSQPGLLAEWRQKLVHELETREEGFVKDGKLVAGISGAANSILLEAGLRVADY